MQSENIEQIRVSLHAEGIKKKSDGNIKTYFVNIASRESGVTVDGKSYKREAEDRDYPAHVHTVRKS